MGPTEGVETMLKHVVLMKFKTGVGETDVADLERGLAGLPAVIPEIRGYDFGRDRRPERTFDFALVSTFDDETALERYKPHPRHQEVLARVKALCDEIRAIDFTY